MENKTVRELVFEALGAASMCWEPTPTGVFAATKAQEIGEKLLLDIKSVLLGKLNNE